MPLIGFDLDGVLAVEDNDKYKQARANGLSAIKHYYENMQPDKFVTTLVESLALTPNYKLHLYTARSNKYHPELKAITVNWLTRYDLLQYFDAIVFTQFRWKYEVMLDRCQAMFDNDIVMLSRLFGVKRIAYKPFKRPGRMWFPCTIIHDTTTLPRDGVI
jgi:hypothetical protein